jgi:hypothetical protein
MIRDLLSNVYDFYAQFPEMEEPIQDRGCIPRVW